MEKVTRVLGAKRLQFLSWVFSLIQSVVCERDGKPFTTNPSDSLV